MKKLLIVLALAAVLVGTAWADDVLVSVVNPEPYRFWFVLDPEDFATEAPDSPVLIDKAASFLTAEGGDFPFAPLEPGKEVVFAGLADGLHYLFGFFESDLLDDLPVQLVGFEVDAEGGDFAFAVLSLPELFMVSRGIGRLAGLQDALIALAAGQEVAEVEEAVVEDTVVEETVVAEVLASFSEYYDPVYFTRESRDGFIVLPIASSRAWGRPGTRLSLFCGVFYEGTITLMLRSEEGFEPNVSFFLYAFPERIVGSGSEYTFEARPDASGRSVVVLWQQGNPVPRLLGTARTDGGEFTWTVSASELPGELVVGFGPSTTFDLTTAWLDVESGTWEEFYFTTFAVADLTR